MDWVSMENELPSLHKMWSLQVRAQVRRKKCYGAALIYSWGTGLNGSVGLWRSLSALGAWGAELPCRERAHPMEVPGGAQSLPCPLCHGPCGEGGIMTQGLVPLPCTLQPYTVLPLQLWGFQTLLWYCRAQGQRRTSWGQHGAESLPRIKQGKTWAVLMKLPWCLAVWWTYPK